MSTKINLKSYISLPASVYQVGTKRSGIPSTKNRTYITKVDLSDHTFIKYKPDITEWDRELNKNNQKLIYALCDATSPHEPKYVGETNKPLKRIKQHINEAVVLNHPSKKSQWIREKNEKQIQVLMRPLLIVDYRLRLQYEKLLRTMLKQLGYPIYNGAKPSRNTHMLSKEHQLHTSNISPFLLELIYNSLDKKSEIRDEFLQSIK